MIKVDLNIDLQKIPLLPFEELRKYYKPHNYLFCFKGSVISKVEPFPTLL